MVLRVPAGHLRPSPNGHRTALTGGSLPPEEGPVTGGGPGAEGPDHAHRSGSSAWDDREASSFAGRSRLAAFVGTHALREQKTLV